MFSSLFLVIPVIVILAVVGLFLLYGLEQRANNKRIERGEAPVKHHDCTDNPPPVNVIDWTRRN